MAGCVPCPLRLLSTERGRARCRPAATQAGLSALALPETCQSRDSWLRFPADPLRRGLALQTQSLSIAEIPQFHHNKQMIIINRENSFSLLRPFHPGAADRPYPAARIP